VKYLDVTGIRMWCSQGGVKNKSLFDGDRGLPKQGSKRQIPDILICKWKTTNYRVTRDRLLAGFHLL
jgi:hypothetical protein